MEWFYGLDGQRHGPVTLNYLRQRIVEGTIPPSTLVWRKSMKDWVPASTVEELAIPALGDADGPPPLPANTPARLPSAPSRARQRTRFQHSSEKRPGTQSSLGKRVVLGIVGTVFGMMLIGLLRQGCSSARPSNTGAGNYGSYDEWFAEQLENTRRAGAGEALYWKGPPQNAEDAAMRQRLEQQAVYNRQLRNELQRSRGQ